MRIPLFLRLLMSLPVFLPDGVTAEESFQPWIETSSHPLKLEWAGDRWLSVASGGVIQSSFDGVNWTASSHVNFAGSGIARLGNTLVLASSVIDTSTDGVHWIERKGPANFSVASMASNGSLIVGLGQNPIRSSTTTDGITWSTPVEHPEIGENSVIWTDSVFVSVGTKIATSPDGISWTPRAWSGPQLLDVTGGEGGLLVAVGVQGKAALSSDGGQTWTAADTGFSQNLTAVAGQQGSFVAIVDGRLIRSADGAVWTELNVSPSSSHFDSVAWSGSQFVAVVSSDGGVFTSTDGLSWTDHSIGSDGSLYATASNPAGMVTVGTGTIMSSANGRDWKRVPAARGAEWRNVLWCGDRYLATGLSGKLATSPDGLSWDIRPAPGADFSGSIAWSGQRAIVTGPDGAVWSSTDFETWTLQSGGIPAGGRYGEILWTGTSFVAFPTGDAGGALRSPDGITWTVAGPPLFSVRTCAAGNGIIVCHNWHARAVSTDDGLTWTSTLDSLVPGDSAGEVIWDGSRFVASDSGDGTMTSPDGVTWTRAGVHTSYPIQAMAFTAKGYLAVGAFGTTWMSGGRQWSTAKSPDVSSAENAAGVSIAVTLSRAMAEDTRISYATRAGTATAGTDYQASSGQILIPAGQLQAVFTIPLIDDAIFEGKETFIVDFLSVEGEEGLFLEDGGVQITINENDPANVIIDPVSVNEWGGMVQVRIHCEDARSVPILLQLVTNPYWLGGAVAGTDYTAIPTTLLTMLPEENEIFLPITILDDYISELDEQFYIMVQAASPSGVKQKGGIESCLITIIDGGPGFDGALIAQGLIKRYGITRFTPDADFDKDGLANLTAYGFDVPIMNGFRDAARSYLPAARVSAAGDRMELRASLPDPLPIGVRCDVEESGDGKTWARTAWLTREGGWQNSAGVPLQQEDPVNGRRETKVGYSHLLAEKPTGLMRLKWVLLSPQ